MPLRWKVIKKGRRSEKMNGGRKPLFQVPLAAFEPIQLFWENFDFQCKLLVTSCPISQNWNGQSYFKLHIQ
jgi:hypothetical protein